jgi:hypothetical protein
MVSEDDATLLAEELCALEAIFEEDCVISHSERRFTVWIPRKVGTPRLELQLLFPSFGYPSQQPPAIQIRAPQLSYDMHAHLLKELQDLFLPGEVCCRRVKHGDNPCCLQWAARSPVCQDSKKDRGDL